MHRPSCTSSQLGLITTTRFTPTRHSDIVHPVSSSQLTEARDCVRSFRGYNTSVVPTSLVDECYRRAPEARYSAEMASMPSQKTHFLDLEQRWLRVAESVAKTVRDTGAPIAQPNIAAPDVDQPSHGAQGKDVAAPHRPDEIGDEQARSANLTEDR